MPKRYNFSAQSAASAREAANELARLRHSARASRDGGIGTRSAHVPRPHGGKRTIPGSRNSPTIFEQAGFSSVGNFLGRGIAGEFGFSPEGFGQSFAQMASGWSNLFQDAQRIS